MKLDEVIDKVKEETGARVFVLGEAHDQQGSVQYIRDSLKDLKAKNITTMYVEIGSDMQGLVDKALQGDEASQRDLRMKQERWWYYGGTDAAQQRYDLLFEANKAGIQVKCVDMDERMDHMQRYNAFDDKNESARLAISDPVLARNIQRVDDGGQAIFLIGKAHTYAPSADGHFEELEGQDTQYYQSAHGGIDHRLNERGIKTASIDFISSDKATPSLGGGDGFQNDFRLSLKSEAVPEDAAYHKSTGYRVYWDRLATIYEHAGIQASVAGDTKLASQFDGVSRNLNGLIKTLDDPAFLKMETEKQATLLQDKVDKINKQIDPLEMQIEDEVLLNAAATTRSKWLSPEKGSSAAETWKGVVQDNQFFHTPEAQALWRKEPMALAGPADKIAISQPEPDSVAPRNLQAELNDLLGKNVVGTVKAPGDDAAANAQQFSVATPEIQKFKM